MQFVILHIFPVLSLSSIADAATACDRLLAVFEAETLDEILAINCDLDAAVRAEGVSFTWDGLPPRPEDPKKKAKGSKMGMNAGKRKLPSTPPPALADDGNIFKVTDIDLQIPRGQLVAIVGAVGAGKTSLLQGLIGEMRRTSGNVEFGGSVGYCAQVAWIQVSILISLGIGDSEKNRMQPFGKTSVLVVHLKRSVTGRLFEMHA